MYTLNEWMHYDNEFNLKVYLISFHLERNTSVLYISTYTLYSVHLLVIFMFVFLKLNAIVI